ncbi:phosducin-like protein 2 [Salvelinus alpinus]|uniref:phosducin-like protein 2 n=1 Tax=Salvelinus alpinus TaxID=8036 RepID=UPI0039FCEA98
MQQANENQARRDRSCFESLTLWDLKNHNHNPPLWVVKDREEDVEYQERSESEEGDEEEEEEEYVCVIIEGSEVEEDEEEEDEEEEEEYEVTCVGEYVEEEEEEYEVTGVGEYVEEEEEEEECLLEVVVKEEEVEEDEEERVETYEKEKNEKGENKEEEEEEDAEEEEKGENKETVEEEEAEEEEGKVEEEEAEEEEQETTNTYPRCVHHQGLKLSVNGLRGRQTGEEKYGQLREILGDQYVREVTCAPEGDRVVLHLYHPSVPMCSLLNHHFSHLAPKFPECKFLMILAGQCVPNYPASHLPTLFIYDSGCILNSLIGEKACGGRNVLEDELKWMLAQSGAFVIDSYEALYQEGTPITTPRSEQEQEDYSDDQSDHYDNQGAEV